MLSNDANIAYDYDGNIIPIAKNKGNVLSTLSKPK